MFHVMSCNKYSLRTLRIVESEDIQTVLAKPMMGECALCGPCSHVELGHNGAYWDLLSTDHETAEDASQAAWALIDTVPDTYDRRYLPERVHNAIV